MQQWIWLDPDRYPLEQHTFYTLFSENRHMRYCCAEFRRTYSFPQRISEMRINVSADAKYLLYVNGEFVGQGPVCHGGDYGFDGTMPYCYYNSYKIPCSGNTAGFYALVPLIPTVQSETSWGHGGFMLEATVFFEDGTQMQLSADESWESRLDRQHYAVNKTDRTMMPDAWRKSVVVHSDRVMRPSPIENLVEEIIFPYREEQSADGRVHTFEFDKIYSGYYRFHVRAPEDAEYLIVIKGYEKPPVGMSTEILYGKGSMEFRSLKMVSCGIFTMEVTDFGSHPVTVEDVSFLFTHYPCPENGSFCCSEPELNQIYELGKHTLKLCRQTLELDSPMHQENLGCTGDYRIASLMNNMTYGNMELTRFDLVRTTDYLAANHCKMFHTTYSMLWIQMLYEYYLYSGDLTMPEYAKPVMEKLLERFDGYLGQNGIIDHPPDYMFVDWLMVDGNSMHHPPKALGQGVLSAFYYQGLVLAEKLERYLADKVQADLYQRRACAFRKAFHETLYDAEKGLYFDGLNDAYETNAWLPPNVSKRYYSVHTNSLAVLYGLCPEDRKVQIMEKVMKDSALIQPQPYFMHFVLDAIAECGLFADYGLDQIRRWKCMLDFSKGLKEGWYDFTGGYGFDYSHVWGGTPTYQLPVRLSGLKILKPGFREIELSPHLFGLKYAQIEIPTPFGKIEIQMKDGEELFIKVPDEICLKKAVF